MTNRQQLMNKFLKLFDKTLPEGFGQKAEATMIHQLVHLCGRD